MVMAMAMQMVVEGRLSFLVPAGRPELLPTRPPSLGWRGYITIAPRARRRTLPMPLVGLSLLTSLDPDDSGSSEAKLLEMFARK